VRHKKIVIAEVSRISTKLPKVFMVKNPLNSCFNYTKSCSQWELLKLKKVII